MNGNKNPPTPENGYRRAFELSPEQSQRLGVAIVADGDDETRPATNQVWLELGEQLGFIWSTVEDVQGAFHAGGVAGQRPIRFTAEVPDVVARDDTEAQAWLAAACMEAWGSLPTGDGPEFAVTFMVEAWHAGRQAGLLWAPKLGPQHDAVGWPGEAGVPALPPPDPHHLADMRAITEGEIVEDLLDSAGPLGVGRATARRAAAAIDALMGACMRMSCRLAVIDTGVITVGRAAGQIAAGDVVVRERHPITAHRAPIEGVVTDTFGQDWNPGPRRCRVCGCTETSACHVVDDANDRPCGWAGPDLCDAPACLAAAAPATTRGPGVECSNCGCNRIDACDVPTSYGSRACHWIEHLGICDAPACIKAAGYILVPHGIAGRMIAEAAGLKPIYRTGPADAGVPAGVSEGILAGGDGQREGARE